MSDPPASSSPLSPISAFLKSLNMSRDDLLKHSDKMRQFLSVDDANSLRVLVEQMQGERERDATPSRAPSTSAPPGKSLSRTSSFVEPRTPVKREEDDGDAVPSTSSRPMDTMEAIIEAKSRQSKRDRRERRAREKAASAQKAAAAAASSSQTDPFALPDTRGERRVEGEEAEQEAVDKTVWAAPVTPQHNKYYRDYDAGSSTKTPFIAVETPSDRVGDASRTHPSVSRTNSYYKNLPQSSPMSSPARPVNLVSSPGPMGPAPQEEEYDTLPYKLPPGPYSSAKPEGSYAALVGQAILSSPQHRLTLQEIYDWITIVYPHFSREDQTWMNSIRHVLSTTACFRKVPRDRSVGRTLWAIWDCDLECFKDGGFKKQYCADMAGTGGRKARKRAAGDEDAAQGGKKKRARKGSNAAQTGLPVPPMSHAQPLFPPTRPSAHHQPYYESCLPRTVPIHVAYSTIAQASTSGDRASGSTRPSTAGSESKSDLESEEPSFSYPEHERGSSASPPPPSSDASVPALTPNGSSSSPPLEEETPPDERRGGMHPSIATLDDDAVFGSATPNFDALEPSITLLNHQEEQEEYRGKRNKGKRKQTDASRKSMALPPMPVSPTPTYRSTRSRTRQTTPPSYDRHSTPPSRPVTPPRNRRNTYATSPVRTPISHKGLHMSPSASLAHYKSHLDPPPPAHANAFIDSEGHFVGAAVQDRDAAGAEVSTPSRKRTSSSLAHSVFGAPVTPKKLVFPGSGESPFRTPGRAALFDPHDPSVILSDELARFEGEGAGVDSPAGGFLGKGSRHMLYESPTVGSPGRYTRW